MEDAVEEQEAAAMVHGGKERQSQEWVWFLLFLCWFKAEYLDTSFGGDEALALFSHSIL